MRKVLFIGLMAVIASTAAAQNWQTIGSRDTAYFTAGAHFSFQNSVYYPRTGPTFTDSPILRMAYVTEASLSGGDSVLRFFTSLRDTSNTNPYDCVDTAGPSWLGSVCIRKPDGTEYYFNSYGDTVIVRTQAAQGESWLLAKDTSGRNFMGRISWVGVTNIDGSPDSFKTISIQAYSAGIPVANPYNALVLQLSKSHGWIQTLDLYRFPNLILNSHNKGLVIDGGQHLRLPAAFRKGRMVQRIDWKYAPGNEWIWKLEENCAHNPDGTPQYVTVRHDSVLSFRALGPGIGLATIRSVEFKSSHVFVLRPGNPYDDASGVVVRITTDTVRDIVDHAVPLRVENDWRQSSHYRYFAWPYDTVRYFIKHARLAHIPTYPAFRNGCMRFTAISASMEQNYFEIFLPDFGQTGAYRLESTTQGSSIAVAEYGRYIYIRTGNSSFGTKINVPSLSMEEMPSVALFTLRPNPANTQVSISSALPPQQLQVTLRDISGHMLREAPFLSRQISIPTGDIPAGLYFVEIVGAGIRHIQKVLIRH